jgi:hypothetical protein
MTSHDLVYKPSPPGATTIGETSPPAAVLARPSGPAAAVVLAAGFGCFTLGFLSVFTAASSGVSEALTLSERVGDVSGISTAAAAVFFTAWAALTIAWRRADLPLLRLAAVSGLLLALGLLGTFPPFFHLFD